MEGRDETCNIYSRTGVVDEKKKVSDKAELQRKKMKRALNLQKQRRPFGGSGK